MKHQPTFLAVPTYNAKRDITEDWHFATDPENERGEYAEALFMTYLGVDGETKHHLIGMTVEDTDDIRFIDREETIRLLSEGTVCDIEDAADLNANWTEADEAAYRADVAWHEREDV